MSHETIELKLPSGLSANVLKKGHGAPLVFFHSHLGQTWDGFLEALAERFTVYAPRHPGTEDEAELMQLDAISDLVLYYDDLFAALSIENPVLVGHSFGGMVAAEYAAYFTSKVKKLVLIDALGLWVDATPVADINGMADRKIPALLFADATGSAAVDLFAMPKDPVAMAKTIVTRVSTRAAVSHFIWPIPDRDLRRRLYRIAAPTLVVWGNADRYVPPLYADEFVAGIAGASKVLIAGAGHFPHVEKQRETADAVLAFTAR
jgi:pimeloyl-ACP methyl ester carboxylesterase